jgi:pimeloyl-ACP methyl ester carboxylesterase
MRSTDVSWPIGPTTVDGTLALPDGPGPFPAVVMVAGSGPTDRDWCSPLLPGTNGSARLLAGSLAAAGFASLRYDKRGLGPRGRETLQLMAGHVSMQSHTEELAGAVGLLAGRAEVRGDRIFALGNSEGTLHALNYQVGGPALPFAGLVLVGPPGRSVGAVARSQLAAQAAAFPNGDALLALYDEAIARFVAGEPAAPDPALPEAVQMLIRSVEAPVNQPFSRELWSANAAAPLARVDAPVLVVIGKKDIQVDWRADGEPLQRAAAGRANVTFLFPEDCNHILKHEPRPRAELSPADVGARYNAPDERLDPQTLAAILDWLRAHA